MAAPREKKQNLRHLKLARPHHNREAIDEIYLSQISFGLSPDGTLILQSIDLQIPTDQILLIESENPLNSVAFLQLMSGKIMPLQGEVLWNQKNCLSMHSGVEYRDFVSSYFENDRAHSKLSIDKILKNKIIDSNELEMIFDLFELTQYKNSCLNSLPFSYQKLTQLILVLASYPEILTLEDPAYGLLESHWLAFLDLIQYYQRRGYLRHIFMTNTHPTALNHLSHQKVFLSDGLIYIDQTGFKKASHF